MLKLKNITKFYQLPGQTIKAVNGVDLEFRKNEFVSILGPSGCGKTTTLNILGGLDQYTDGDLIIDGKSTKDFGSNDWDNYRNKRVGFVFQSYNLISHLTVAGNVEMALTISGISLSERKARAKEALERVGLGDHINKKPNQLSGGQMQRVAIARAIVNRPEILLLDEPTGALDTNTSIQIMELIKEIGKDKLIIMVTHNPELAEEYSERLVHMKDGKVSKDTNPYDSSAKVDEVKSIEQAAAVTPIKNRKEKTSMSFFTALGLSARNLKTKKKRSIMTAVASAIGILGIGLILSLTTGLNAYISDLTRNNVESSPITISSGTVTQSENAMRQNLERFPEAQTMFVERTMEPRNRTPVPLGLREYFEDNFDSSWYNDILFRTGMDVRVFSERTGGAFEEIAPPMTGMFAQLVGTHWQQLLAPDLTLQLYDIVNTGGRLPQNENEIAIVVNDRNAISDTTLMQLGLWTMGDTRTEFSFDEVAGKQFKIPTNNQLYSFDGNVFAQNPSSAIDFSGVHTVEITAVLRRKDGIDMGLYGMGLAYPLQLVEWLETANSNSDIVQWMIANPLYDPFNNVPYTLNHSGMVINTPANRWEDQFRVFGGVPLAGITVDGIGRLEANEISIYARDLAGKNAIVAVLDNYNATRPEAEQIVYEDLMDMIASIMSNMVNVISWVLIGFTSISLIVSAVMISIITSISVLERTKEIGILRSIGARKKDVTRLFNAENVLLGLLAGLVGTVTTLLLTLPINLIFSVLLGASGLASFTFWHALILIGVSTGVAFVSGFLPARKAAKKDPVLALRSE
ncbi:MAG: ABC transporter ATP-binding protein/permease [Firmicutes bacterium]|nr:ABC transporter ATP-binding protein/permease [Bacillota bacterium]